MLARRILIVSAVAFSSTFVAPVFVGAQETPAPDVANAPYQFLGEITAANTFVRSGPREGDYATLKLDKSAQITVVGIKFDWLKILPPEGSFSYVSKAFVQQFGDGKRGRVTKNDLSVRAGSSVPGVNLKSQVQTKLNDGDEVEIIGEQDEYFRIKPPAGAYVYVKKDFVRPLRAINNGTAERIAEPDYQQPTPGNTGTQALDTTTDPTGLEAGAPGVTDTAQADPAQPQATTAAGEKFSKLEERYTQALAMPLDQQPIEALQPEYEALSKGNELPESMRSIAEGRLAALKIRKQAKDELLAVRKQHEEMQARNRSLRAEQEEIEQQLKANAVEVYNAVGTLRASSLQRGEGRLYRLTDPQSGRTLVYIRTDDTQIATMIGQFVGVRGATATEPQLQLSVITPQIVKPVDIAAVGKGVVAQILPPSIVTSGATASTGATD